jgi:signal transduction histidine kinase
MKLFIWILFSIFSQLQAQVWEHDFVSQINQQKYRIQTDTKKQQISINKSITLPFQAFQQNLLGLKQIPAMDSLALGKDYLYLWKKQQRTEIPLDLWENIQMAVVQEELKALPQSVGASIDNKGVSGFFNLQYLFLGSLLLSILAFLIWRYIAKLKQQKRDADARKSEMEIMRNHLLKDFEVKTKVILAEIHDGPLQNLARFSRQLGEMQHQQTDLGTQMQQTKIGIEQISQELRNISANITPSELSDIGLDSAIRSLLRKFKQQNPEIIIEQQLDKESLSLPENIRLMLYRIFQEALNNIEKHAQATQINVELRLENGIQLQIQDNGIGFNPQTVKSLENGNHLGLSGIQSRCQDIGATLSITAAPQKGTSIRIARENG